MFFMRNVEGRKRNRQIVLNYLTQSGEVYFKCKKISKKINELTQSQVSDGLRTLHKEGYIKYHNPSQTWTITEKMKKG